MKTKKISSMIALGICLIAVSLIMMIAFYVCGYIGAQQSHRIASKIQEILPETIAGMHENCLDTGMPVLETEGTDYVAILDVPAFGITLPVKEKWDSKKLFLSPSRFCGSAYDGTLVIGGSDNSWQFGFCDQIANGAMVTVTDMTGTQFAYAVSKVERSKHADSQWLKDTDCDLTLFCYNTFSMEYIAVRCNFVFNEQHPA